ncbi:MAG: hypothetical protein ABF243_00270 [Celeribacter marinus]
MPKRFMLLKILLSVLMAGLLAVSLGRGARAQATSDDIDALMDALHMTQIVEVLAKEGRGMIDDLEVDGSGVPHAAWVSMLADLYRADVMLDAFRGEMGYALEGADIAPMLAFFESDFGQTVAQLELDARIAMGDEGMEDMAAQAWAELAPNSARAELIDAYVTANDLIEMNVVGAMNADYAYMVGLGQSGGDVPMMSDADILRDIWSYEPEVRADISQWVYGYSTLAYEPLSDDEFAQYIAFSKSPAGSKLNYALFAAFDAVYADLSRALGAGTGQLLHIFDGQEL